MPKYVDKGTHIEIQQGFMENLATALLGIGQGFQQIQQIKQQTRGRQAEFEALPLPVRERIASTPELRRHFGLGEDYQVKVSPEDQAQRDITSSNVTTARANATLAQNQAGRIGHVNEAEDLRLEMTRIQAAILTEESDVKRAQLAEQAKALISPNFFEREMKGFGRTFEEAQKMYLAKNHPEMVGKELDIQINPQHPEAIERRTVSVWQDLKGKGMEHDVALVAARAIASNDVSLLAQIPSGKMRTLAERQYYLEVQQTHERRAQIEQAKNTTIAQLALNLSTEKNIPTANAERLARDLVNGRTPRGADSAVLDYANNQLNVMASLRAQELQKKITDEDMSELRQAIPILQKQGEAGDDAAADAAEALSKRLTELTAMKFGVAYDPDAPGLAGRLVEGVSKYVIGGAQAGVATVQDAMQTPTQQKQSLIDQVVSDALGSETLAMMESVRAGVQGMLPGNLIMDTVTQAPKAIMGAEKYLEELGSRVPGIRIIARQAMESRAKALMSESRAAGTPAARKAEIRKELEVLNGQLEKMRDARIPQ